MNYLGDRMDDFFDNCRRRPGTNLREFVTTWIKTYEEFKKTGERLSEKAKCNRLLKCANLPDGFKREVLTNAGGEYKFTKIENNLVRVQSVFAASATPTIVVGATGGAAVEKAVGAAAVAGGCD